MTAPHGYTAKKLTPLQEKTWEAVEGDYQRLLLLQEQSPETVFGEKFKQAFIPVEKLESGARTLCVGCMDGRVPGPKIGVAGSAVLMTKITDETMRMTDEQMYEYLSNPDSGNELFRALVSNLRTHMEQGWKLDVSEHVGCGAVSIFCALFKKQTGRDLDAARVAEAVATRLHRALGIDGRHKRADYELGEIRMNGDPHIHDEYCLVVDGTGRVNLETLGIRGLLLSSAKYLKGDTPEMKADADDYLQTEVEKGTEIIASDHGVGLESAPVFLIGDPDDPECSVESLERRLGDMLKGRTVLRITAPKAA